MRMLTNLLSSPSRRADVSRKQLDEIHATEHCGCAISIYEAVQAAARLSMGLYTQKSGWQTALYFVCHNYSPAVDLMTWPSAGCRAGGGPEAGAAGAQEGAGER